MEIGITGSSGGLGRRLVEFLLKNNYSVRTLDRNPQKTLNFQNSNINCIKGDITNPDTLTAFIKDLDICIHLAARVEHASKKEYYRVNYLGTRNLCRALLQENPSCRFIYCSTISTLNVNPFLRINSSLYALSKYSAEMLVLKYTKYAGLNSTIIYPGVIFGNYDRYIFPSLIKYIKKGTILFLKGGEAKAPFIYTDDLCGLFMKVIASPVAIGKRYVSVKGLDIGVHEFIRIVAHELGCTVSGSVHSALLIKVAAVILNFIYRLLHIKKRPPLTRTMADILGGNIKKYNKIFDDPYKDLGWQQETSREVICKQISSTLAFLSGRN